MRKSLAPVAGLALLGLAACGGTPQPVMSVANAPVRMTVNDPIAGIAQLLTADIKQGVDDLIAAGADGPNADVTLADSLTCGRWLLSAIPQAQQMTSGAIPSFQAKGAYSAFIEGKIALRHIKGIAGSAKTQFIDVFNHNCGASIAGDVNAINQLLLKVGITVVPGGGAVGGILGGLIPGLP